MSSQKPPASNEPAPAVPVDAIVTRLMPQFARERQEEDDRLRSKEDVRISPWNPRTTMQWDIDRVNKRVADLRRWCEAWWRRHGLIVVWGDDAKWNQLPSATLKSV